MKNNYNFAPNNESSLHPVMRKYLFTFLSFAFFLITLITSCSSEEPLLASGQNPAAQESYHVSIPEALSRAEKLMETLDNHSQATRSLPPQREVRDINVIKQKMLTRSTSANLPDTLFYIINYADNSGFALVSADKRTVPVYAISSEGEFNIQDTVFNKGLAHFFENVSADMSHSISYPVLPVDTTKYTDIDIKTEEIIGPYLSKSQAEWNQTYPFNRLCPSIGNSKALVGCLAVATGQIMSFYQYPKAYMSHSYNWNNINSNHHCDDLAYLLSDLGRPENLDNDYGIRVTLALFNNLDRTLFNMGYEHCGYGIPFTRTDILKYLKNGPVFFSGRRYDNEGNSLGHAFVCDGYIEYLTTVALPNRDILYHCIWGWGGQCNGYYYWTDGFDLRNPIRLDPDEPQSSSDRFYNHGLNIWGNFKIRN